MSRVFLSAIAAVSFASCLFYCVRPAIAQIAPTNSATISGSISDAGGRPVPGARITLIGPKHATTQTDAGGLFLFVGVPFGDYVLSAAASGLGTATRSLSVQGDTNVAIQYEPASVNGLKTIAQVSSNAQARFNVTPASITQVNPRQNAFEGKTSWRRVLEQIPGVAQTGVSSGNNIYAAMPDSPLTPVRISIDGGLPYETATLLDEMPLIGNSYLTSALPGTGTDIGLYPLNAFGEADVVRGPGANAPSIVDSIGGSFVLHAPGPVTHDGATFSMSTDPYGGIVTNALADSYWKKLSAVVTYGVNDSPGPNSHDGIPGFTKFNPLTVNGQSFARYAPTVFLSDPRFSPTTFPTYGEQPSLLICCVDQSTAWSQHSGSFSLTYTFSPQVRAEAFYAGQTTHQAVYYPDYTVNFPVIPGYSGGIQSGTYFFSRTDGVLAPCFITQTSSLLEEKITAQVGRGILRVAALQNKTFSTASVSSTVSANVQLYGAGYLNGSVTPTIFNGENDTITFPAFTLVQAYRNNNRDVLLSYSTSIGENAHAGVSYVRSYYNEPYNVFCSLFGTFLVPSDISQTTNELRLYAGGNPSKKTSLDLSMYFVNASYHVPDPANSSINTQTNTNATYVDTRYAYAAPRLGFVWHPTSSVAIRAAAGGGFAEAPLSELVSTSAIPTFNGSLSAYTVSLNNLNLQPEKSFAFDTGIDIRLRQGTTLSFDLYRADLYGQIYKASLVNGTYNDGSHGVLPLYATQYGNLGRSRYEGILFDLRHDVPHGFYWIASGGLTRGYMVSVPAGFYNAKGAICNFLTTAGCTNLQIVPGINFNGTFGGNAAAIPYAQGSGSIGYRWNSDKFIELMGTYYGNNNTYFRPAFVELDGNIGYPLTKNVSLVLTFRNITGIYDGGVQVWNPVNMMGAPAVAGLPFAEFGENYGPRTVIITSHVSL